ncbi:MAG TPA: tetratricopeptide repeat protein, partial [Phycisphaerae bacterium]|nr:tetratricopeptide repeat protein [Phycisphaerae bacterium]
IYFLGPKGFCTYACPYGAIFAISDKFAPSRIRVNDNCNQCGHCTAVCTSNVDVAQEVNLYKMVVDPGCMKCLDCIEVCPTNALSVGWGMPSLGAKPAAAPRPRKYDLTLVEEIAALGLFFVVLVTVNGLYGQFPFLLSLAIAGIVTYVLLKSARLIYGPDVLVQKMRLKVNCRVTPAGAAWLAGSLLLAGMLVHSAIWRYHDLLGNRAFAAGPPQPLDWQYNPSFHKTATPEQMEQIRSAAGHYEAMRRIGLVSLPEHRLHLAWAYLHTGKPDDAGKEIAAATRERPGLANLWLWRAKIMTYLDRPGDARDAFSKAMDLEQEEYGSASAADMKEPRPLSAEIWAEWGRFLLREGDPAGAGDALEKSVSFDPAYQIGRRALVDYYLAANRVGDARRTALQGLEHGFRSSKLSEVFDRIRIAENNPAAAIDDYTQALTRHPDDVLLLSNLAAALAEANRPADAAALCRRALKKAPDSAGLHATLGAVLVMTNDLAGAIREYQTVLRLLPSSADAAFRLAFLYAQTGRPAEAVPLLEKVRQTGAPDERKTAQQLLNELQGSQPSPRE